MVGAAVTFDRGDNMLLAVEPGDALRLFHTANEKLHVARM